MARLPLRQHKTYRCKVADVVTLAEDGRLRADDSPKAEMRQFYDGAIIDTLTGAVTYRDGTQRNWKVIKKGSGDNDYVLVPDVVMPDADDFAVVAATDFIRVRAWKEKPKVRFLVFGLEHYGLWALRGCPLTCRLRDDLLGTSRCPSSPAKTSAAFPRRVCRRRCRQSPVRYPTVAHDRASGQRSLWSNGCSYDRGNRPARHGRRGAHLAEGDFLREGRHVVKHVPSRGRMRKPATSCSRAALWSP